MWNLEAEAEPEEDPRVGRDSGSVSFQARSIEPSAVTIPA